MVVNKLTALLLGTSARHSRQTRVSLRDAITMMILHVRARVRARTFIVRMYTSRSVTFRCTSSACVTQ